MFINKKGFLTIGEILSFVVRAGYEANRFFDKAFLRLLALYILA
jgi:hypothetical protein